MGRGIALVLAKEEGCRVYVTARDGKALDTLSKEVSETDGEFETLDDCNATCSLKPSNTQTIITVFLYENCPIAQYMCGPLREASRYFCDTLNQNMIFRGFSPNSFSTDESLSNFVIQ